MEKKEKWNEMVKVFTLIMHHTLAEKFRLPKGRNTESIICQCIVKLEDNFISLSRERVIDYCVCQVFDISKQKDIATYLKRWNVNRSFGRMAIERFLSENPQRMYYENQWLAKYSLTREWIADKLNGHAEHPFAKYINPTFEESTKRRLHNTEGGYMICRIGTLLWNPYSECCKGCDFSEPCKEELKSRYSELYRLRTESYNLHAAQ